MQQSERNVIVDSIRGFALVGVLIANFTGYNNEQVPDAVLQSISSPLDNTLMHIIWMFAAGWLAVEIIFSTWWLRTFRYGHVEWIWRQLTYRRRIKLRK